MRRRFSAVGVDPRAIVKRRGSIADNSAMIVPGSPRPSGFSPWWALMILPVAAAIGWGIGQAPAPPPPAPNAAADLFAAGEAPDASPSGAAPAGPSEPGAATAAKPDPAVREELSSWMGYSFAMDESRRTGKPILLDFNADWCGPCRMMKQQVFDDRGYGRSVQLAVIPVSVVDRMREDGRNSDEVESLMRRFRIEAFPTLVVYSPVTGRSEETRGFGGAEYTVDWITRAARSVR
jgi:thiol-disulfide isomerase/thioredoxin